jgi:hypothetical protein
MIDYEAIQNKVIDYINSHEEFWLSDLKIFVYGDLSGYSREYQRVTNLINKFKGLNYICCSEIKGRNTKYMRLIEIKKNN